MIGTSKELLLLLSKDSKYANLLNMSRQRLVWFRMKVAQDGFSEQRIEEYLKKIQKNLDSSRVGTRRGDSFYEFSTVRCVRQQYVLPAVVCDHHGRLFLETALVKACSRSKEYDDLNLKYVVMAMGNDCQHLPNEEIVRELLRRKGWYMVEPRYVVPAIWEIA